MKPLIAVERKRSEHDDVVLVSLYLRYSREPVARTESLDGEVVNVDYDATGAVIGIEVADVDDDSIALATKFANEHGLGLAQLAA